MIKKFKTSLFHDKHLFGMRTKNLCEIRTQDLIINKSKCGLRNIFEVPISRPLTLECPVADPVGVDLSWSRHGLPVTTELENVQVKPIGSENDEPKRTVSGFD